jgi:hypothetical protein
MRRFFAHLTLLLFTLGVSGGASWAERVLCIHPGDSLSYAHIEKNDLSEINLGEFHLSLSPDEPLFADKIKIKVSKYIPSPSKKIIILPNYPLFETFKVNGLSPPFLYLKSVRLLI